MNFTEDQYKKALRIVELYEEQNSKIKKGEIRIYGTGKYSKMQFICPKLKIVTNWKALCKKYNYKKNLHEHFWFECYDGSVYRLADYAAYNTLDDDTMFKNRLKDLLKRI